LKVLILDNYDSFTYNLLHYCDQFADEVIVVRNDEIEMGYISNFDKLILSPGPGLPKQAGNLMNVIEHAQDKIPILGVCLGMQAIAEFFGFPLRNLETVKHGKTSIIQVLDESEPLFADLPNSLEVGHYHSWVVDEGKLKSPLHVTSKNQDGLAMSFRHESLDICGVQFHPESVLTPDGLKMIDNWIKC
jgi:anthranilate synthase component 2